MNRFKRIAVTAFAVAALASTMAWAQDAPQGDAANGKRIYLADGCFTCHGRSGQGGAYTGPAPILAHTALAVRRLQGGTAQPRERHAGLFRGRPFRQGHRRHLRVRRVAARPAVAEGHLDPQQLRGASPIPDLTA